MYHTIRRHQRLTRNDVMKDLEELKKSIGAARRPSDLSRYPQDAMRNDLNRIGRDMYKAMEDYSAETAPTKEGEDNS